MLTIAERIEDLIQDKKTNKNKKINLRLIADEINDQTNISISISTLSKLMDPDNTEHRFDYHFFMALAQYFDVSVDYLLGLTETKETKADVKQICNTTGLDSESVNTLIQINANRQLYILDDTDDSNAKDLTCQLFYQFLAQLIENANTESVISKYLCDAQDIISRIKRIQSEIEKEHKKLKTSKEEIPSDITTSPDILQNKLNVLSEQYKVLEYQLQDNLVSIAQQVVDENARSECQEMLKAYKQKFHETFKISDEANNKIEELIKN